YFLLQKGFSNFKNDDFLAKNQEKKLVASPQPQRMESLLNEVLKTQVSEEPFPGIYNKINESTLNKGNKK
ncbi:MAG: hypothetical protein LBJ71_00150, partial [Holosporaceae bacterium]|nr:hypothetical protein [Holosporaceae bacterium]